MICLLFNRVLLLVLLTGASYSRHLKHGKIITIIGILKWYDNV